MSNPNLPPCFCNDDANGCDWVVNVTMSYSRPGHPDMPTSTVEWEMAQIPQLLAQAILQAGVSAINEKGAEVYATWAQGCIENETPTELIARVRAML